MPAEAALVIEPEKGPGPGSSALRSWGAVGCRELEIPKRKQNVGGALAFNS